jgi:heme/copper-type cytochrome/quinol oxidase subunit 2
MRQNLIQTDSGGPVKTPFRILLLMMAAIILACTVPVLQSPATKAQEQHVIEMTAKKYEFSSSPVHVKAGTTVVLKITATDRPHGFRISPIPDGAAKDSAPGLVLTSPAPKDCYKLEKGQQVSIEIQAKTPGTYTFKCCVHCGMGHGGMKGQLIVDPS